MSDVITVETFASIGLPKAGMATEQEREGLSRTASTAESVAATVAFTTTSLPKGVKVKAGQTHAFVDVPAISATTCAAFATGSTVG